MLVDRRILGYLGCASHLVIRFVLAMQLGCTPKYPPQLSNMAISLFLMDSDMQGVRTNPKIA